MKAIINVFRLALVLSMCAIGVSAQDATAGSAAATTTAAGDSRVALTEAATAFDAAGRVALGGRLRTVALAGTQDAPTRNVLIAIENRSPFFYNYVSGSATFYDTGGVRCGEGMWKLATLAVGEVAEVDTPGLRLTCTPATWRIVAVNLLTRSSDVAKPDSGMPPATDGAMPAATMGAPVTTSAAAPGVSTASAMPRLEININGRTLPLQIGNPLEIIVGNERVNIVVTPVP
ncbi:MAG TPA: hypothetical protein VEX70_14235 [Pyrinomonadaceae bacterium]|nr:hypothetical protein [Pyrinomonadaceae bacterium]